MNIIEIKNKLIKAKSELNLIKMDMNFSKRELGNKIENYRGRC